MIDMIKLHPYNKFYKNWKSFYYMINWKNIDFIKKKFNSLAIWYFQEVSL